MAEIGFRAVVPGGIGKQYGEYHCRLLHNRIVRSEEVAADMAAKMHIDRIDAQLYISTVCGYIMRSVAEGNMVNFGPFSLYLSLRGKVRGANGAYGEDQEGAALNLKAGAELKAALARLKPVNVTMAKSEKPRIASVLDEAYSTEGVISAGARILIGGSSLYSSGEREDEGVYLEDGEGKTVATGRILASTSTTMDAMFDGDLPAGECRLVLRTRSGDDDMAVPAIARHKVTVAPRK